MRRIFWIVLILLVLQGSTLVQSDPSQFMRRYTRPVEFDFASWTARAVGIRWRELALGTSSFLDEETRVSLVKDYFRLIGEINQVNASLEFVISSPETENPEAAVGELTRQRDGLIAERDEIQGLVESILAEQVGTALADAGINVMGMPLPPVAFHLSATPYALIVSPRDVIRQDVNLQLDAELLLEERIALEQRIEREQDVSALVVATGGIGIYPTMVLESTSLPWILEVIAHEWTHNYLSLRPLGFHYGTSSDLRTMNETVANLMGKEISRQVVSAWYPELLPPEPQPAETVTVEVVEPEFNFHDEMRETRITVDSLLLDGRIVDAEEYMEQRREFFWENRYSIRRLNQAYFAFHGAYADRPGGGAAGADPVGEGVRALWERVNDPAAFLRKMSWMDSTSDLERALLGHP